jgi:hypothetical protein
MKISVLLIVAMLLFSSLQGLANTSYANEHCDSIESPGLSISHDEVMPDCEASNTECQMNSLNCNSQSSIATIQNIDFLTGRGNSLNQSKYVFRIDNSITPPDLTPPII